MPGGRAGEEAGVDGFGGVRGGDREPLGEVDLKDVAGADVGERPFDGSLELRLGEVGGDLARGRSGRKVGR